ncbi:MAG: hypothetical protein KBT57_10500 [bacterium]|nr:hypothetical protein [Candidatus Limimorpha equi]
MPLFNPTKRAQLAHVSNLISMARLDGQLTQNEHDYILLVAKEFGLTQAELDQCFKDSDNLVIEIPKSDDDKVDYMKNLVSMMFSDGVIDKQKRSLAEHICEKFGYDGKQAVDIIYDDLMKEIRESEPEGTADNGEMTEEEFRKELNIRLNKAAQCLMDNDMSGAFDQLFYAALADETARRLFLRIVRGVYPMYMLTDKQVAEMKKLSDEGYAIAKYALGRYHQLVQPDEDSMKRAYDLFVAAAEKGIGDAIFALSLFYRDGRVKQANNQKYVSLLGQVDNQTYLKLREDAIEKGSVKAFYQKAKDIMYGLNDYEADPKYILNFVSNILKDATGDDEKDIFEFEPEYYDLLGRAYQELGDIEKAEDAYIQAISFGFYESISSLILMMCYDEKGNLTEKEMFDKYVEIGIQHNDAFCYTLRGDITKEEYDKLSKREQVRKTEQIKADLEKGYQLGDNIAPWIMGKNYYFGNFGFEENDEEAWDWFNLGAAYFSSNCYSMMVTMIDEGRCPVAADENFRAFCLLCAYRNGEESRLEDVIEAYQNGQLDDFKEEIEKYYLPLYENIAPAEEDDGQSDGDLIDEGVPLIAIIHPDATADIIEFDVCEWDELPAFIGADHLDALRMPGLYEIGHQAGYEENVTGWLDSKGLMKGLPQNAIGRKVYPGPVAGDMILTLEDASYKPMSFYDINALRRVIEALGATVENVCLDDGPDDDGRFDAWA